jgi:hypothetical protein
MMSRAISSSTSALGRPRLAQVAPDLAIEIGGFEAVEISD